MQCQLRTMVCHEMNAIHLPWVQCNGSNAVLYNRSVSGPNAINAIQFSQCNAIHYSREVVTKLGIKMVWNSTAQPPGVNFQCQARLLWLVGKNATSHSTGVPYNHHANIRPSCAVVSIVPKHAMHPGASYLCALHGLFCSHCVCSVGLASYCGC